MKNILSKVIILYLAAVVLPLNGAVENDGILNDLSEGNIRLILDVTESVCAGFVYTNLDAEGTGFGDLRSYSLIESLHRQESANIPFCVISNTGGAFSLNSFEYPGMDNRLESEFGYDVHFVITIGENRQTDSRYNAVTELCNDEEAI